MKKITFASVLVISLLAPISARAQSVTSRSPERVFLSVAVTNERGHWVGGLKADNFRIQHKPNSHRIVSSTFSDAPASIGMLIDTSGSSSTLMGKIEQAATAFVQGGKEGDEYFLMTFSVTPNLLLDRSENRADVFKSLASISDITPKANTSLYDALNIALDKIASGKHEKKALVVISDAMDNVSKVTFKDIREKLRRSDVLFYNINVIDPIDARSQLAELSLARMDELANISGGRVLLPKSGAGLVEISSRTAQEIHNLYRLELELLDGLAAKDKSEWRRLEIEVVPGQEASKIGKLKVRTRDGYYSTYSGN